MVDEIGDAPQHEQNAERNAIMQRQRAIPEMQAGQREEKGIIG